MGIWGSEPAVFSEFAGICPDVDPAELPAHLAADASNVDLYGATLRIRRGRAAYNSTAAHASKTLGLYDYYPTGGGLMIPVLATKGDGKVWADTNNDGDFADAGEAIATGLSTSATWMEFFGYKDRLYFGNGINGLYRWDGSGSAAAVAVLTAPGSAPVAQIVRYVIEDFAGTWTGVVTTNLAMAGGDATAPANEPPEGPTSTRFTASAAPASAARSNYKKNWSAGTQDLSQHRWLQVSALAHYRGAGFRVAIQNNGGVLDYSALAVNTVNQAKSWLEFLIPLDTVSPASRTASPGLGFEWNNRSPKHDGAQSIWVDNAIPISDLAPGAYTYQSTFYNSTTHSESGPSAKGTVSVTQGVSGTVVQPVGTGGGSGVDRVFIYRQHTGGFWRLPKKVGELPYTGALTLNGGINSSVTALVVSAGTNIANGSIIKIDSELMRVTAGGGTTNLTVQRGWGIAATAAAHSNGASVYLCYFDARSDGDVDQAAAQGGGTDGTRTVTDYTDGQELRASLIAPPVAQAYAMGNHRLFAGNVLDPLEGGNPSRPWRVYVSRQGFPEEFSAVQAPGDPGVGGWFDLPDRGVILRIVETDGVVLFLTDRSVWTWEGSGFDDAVVTCRARVGLVSREGVCLVGRRLFFHAEDGLRVIELTAGAEREFPCWLLTEPVRSLVAAIPYLYRKDCALGVDDLGRVHFSIVRSGQTVADAALVFDPRIPGALAPGPNPLRPGWTYYTNWGFSCSRTLKNGAGGESGGQLVGDPTTGKLHRLGIDVFGRDQGPESGGFAWYWTSKALDMGASMTGAVSDLSIETDVTNSQKVRLSAVLDGSTGAGYVASSAKKRVRMPATQRARRVQVRIDSADPGSTDGAAGSLAAHTLAYSLRSVAVGLLAAAPRG